MKQCHRCLQTKSNNAFYPGKKQHWCKECKSKYAHTWYVQEKRLGPFVLQSENGFLQFIHKENVSLSDTVAGARPYTTYRNTTMVKKRLEKMGYIFKIVSLRT